MVDLNDDLLGIFDERPKAIQVAGVVAESSSLIGRASGVLSEEGDGKLLPI